MNHIVFVIIITKNAKTAAKIPDFTGLALNNESLNESII